MRPLLKPCIKYNGGKTKLAPVMREFYWKFFPHSTLVDLFCGSAAISLGINPEKAILVDGNPLITNLHSRIRSNVFDGLLSFYAECEDLYVFTGVDYLGFKDWYFGLREQLNSGELDKDLYTKAAATFALINYGFNGLVRGSKNKLFSTPAGSRKINGETAPPVIAPEKYEALKNGAWMQDWVILERVFEGGDSPGLESFPENSLIYADPPYAREVHTKALMYFPKGDFHDEDQSSLARLLAEDSRPCILSNEDLPSMRQMLQSLGFLVFSYSRKNTISSKTETRGKDKREVFAINSSLQQPEYVEFFIGKFGEPV